MLDNASDGVVVTADCSSALLVSLSAATTPMVATILRKWNRPDGLHTSRRGNVQFLENTNILVSWADFGFTSEFSLNGTLVQQIRSPYERFSEYRQYKFDWMAALHVSEPIALVSHVYGAVEDIATTVLYVSWNGATEVDSWNFYSSASSEQVQHPSLIATVSKKGFETVAMVPGNYLFAFVEAVAKDGTRLQNSTITISKLPPSYVYKQQGTAQSTANKTKLNGLGFIATEPPVQYWILVFSVAVLCALVVYITIRLWRSYTCRNLFNGWRK
jgi:hypothetical protein